MNWRLMLRYRKIVISKYSWYINIKILGMTCLIYRYYRYTNFLMLILSIYDFPWYAHLYFLEAVSSNNYSYLANASDEIQFSYRLFSCSFQFEIMSSNIEFRNEGTQFLYLCSRSGVSRWRKRIEGVNTMRFYSSTIIRLNSLLTR